ncbi:armadillo/beta-catenin/plakoglobin [Amylocystis lapponica]|nr:armadillo/beta-catenin/plakoglobin [Amylocystis lapponica]
MSQKLHVLSHPLINSRLARLRQTTTDAKEFREGIHDISLILGIEASRDLEEVTFSGQTPIGPFTGSMIQPKIGLTPILRAGLGMTDALLNLFPSAPVYHLGIFREKVSLRPVECAFHHAVLLCFDLTVVARLFQASAKPTGGLGLSVGPADCHGGTACAAMNMILEWGVPIERVKLLCVLASQDGLNHVQSEHPGLEVWVAAVDPELTSNGLISPGLGDTGDRLYNTLNTKE